MYSTTQTFIQAHTIFGGGYVPELHGDETARHLPRAEKHELGLDFSEMLKAFRAALSLR